MIQPIFTIRFICNGFLKVHGEIRECGAILELSGDRKEITNQFIEKDWTTKNFIKAKEVPALSTSFHLCDWHDIHVDPTTGERLFK